MGGSGRGILKGLVRLNSLVKWCPVQKFDRDYRSLNHVRTRNLHNPLCYDRVSTGFRLLAYIRFRKRKHIPGRSLVGQSTANCMTCPMMFIPVTVCHTLGHIRYRFGLSSAALHSTCSRLTSTSHVGSTDWRFSSQYRASADLSSRHVQRPSTASCLHPYLAGRTKPGFNLYLAFR